MLYCVARVSQMEGTTTGAQRPPSPQRRERTRRLVHLAILSFAAIMFIDALVGDQGLVALMRARKDLDRLNEQVQRLKDDNAQMAEQTRRLREDRDALEEAARRDLGLMKPGEKLFIVKDLPPPPQP